MQTSWQQCMDVRLEYEQAKQCRSRNSIVSHLTLINEQVVCYIARSVTDQSRCTLRRYCIAAKISRLEN